MVEKATTLLLTGLKITLIYDEEGTEKIVLVTREQFDSRVTLFQDMQFVDDPLFDGMVFVVEGQNNTSLKRLHQLN